MAQAKTKSDASAKPSKRSRFRAWWDGEEVVEAVADAVEAEPPPPPPRAPGPEESEGWTTERIRAAGLIFGEGQIDPIDDDFINEMIRPLGLSDKMTVLEFPAGIGATARAVTRITGAWIQAVESDPVLAAAAVECSTKAGLTRKALISTGEFEDSEIRDESCDVVLSFGGLQCYPDKDQVLARMSRAMKPSGQMVLSDFALTAKGANGPEIEAWIAREATAVAPDTVDVLVARFAQLNLDVRIAEDKGEIYAELVRRALREFLAGAEEREVAPELRVWVMHEIEFWAHRLAALEAGDLGCYRIHAIHA